jgi:hypothetical protein
LPSADLLSIPLLFVGLLSADWLSAGLLSADLSSAGLSMPGQGKAAGLLSIALLSPGSSTLLSPGLSALLSPGLSALDPSPGLEEIGVPDQDGGLAGAAPGNIEGGAPLGVGVDAAEDDISGPGEGDEGAGSADFFS